MTLRHLCTRSAAGSAAALCSPTLGARSQRLAALGRPAAVPPSLPRRPLLKMLGGSVLGALALQGRSVAAAAAQPPTVETILQEATWPEQFPFPADAFERYDET